MSEPALAPSAFSGIDASREAFVSTLASLKEAEALRSGRAPRSSPTAPRIPRRRACGPPPGINGAKDLLSQEEVSNDQLGALTAGCSSCRQFSPSRRAL